MALWLWSYILAVVGLAGLYLAGGPRASLGWSLGIASQSLWGAYAIASEQYGFLVTAFAYGVVYAKNLQRSRPPRQHPGSTPTDTTRE